MFEEIIKNKKGSALVFVMILIANAIIITSSVVFISAIQNRSSGALSLTPEAFQRADSGLEYILQEINHGTPSNVDDLCDSFDNTTKECIINDPACSAYFLDSSDNVLSGSDSVGDIGFAKVVGSATRGSNTIYRSLKATLFQAP
ncbi:MAG: pilus assembly PilX N-terminal domain-containing protein [Candidatus Moranbacteria bacterium]|nr:pilus assembly PilX N-terminal domain-containing protein [Candidatus Moranbacteria bacterium]